jgi:hypothetical protein
MVTESVYLPTDPLLETQTIPTFPKMQPQPQIIDSTPSETTLDSPNLEHIDTETDGIKPHLIPTMETPVQDQLQEAMTSTPTSMTEPLLLQLASPISPLTTPLDYCILDRIQPSPIAKPDNWAQMSKKQIQNWYQHKR